MAKGKGSIQGWITKNGVHIPIYGSYTVKGGVEPKAKGAKFRSKLDLSTTGNSNASKGHVEEGKGAVKDVQGKRVATTKDEEYKSKLAEANKAFDAGDYKEYNRRAKELKQMQASGEVSDEIITGKTQAQRERDDAKFQARQRANEANSLVNQGMDRDSARKVANEVDFSKMSYSEAGKYVAAHKEDFGLKAGDDAYQAAYEMKQGTWKQPKEEKKTVSSTESYPSTKSFGSNEPSAREYGEAMDSIGKRYDRENKTVPGREMGKVFEGLKPGDEIQVHNKYSVSPDRYTVNDDGTIDYSSPSSSFAGKKGMSLAEAQKHATNSVDNRITVMRKKTGEGSSKSNTAKSYSIDKKSDNNYYITNPEKGTRYTVTAKNEEDAAKQMRNHQRAGKADQFDFDTPKRIAQESSTKPMSASQRVRAERESGGGTNREVNFKSMTVSGLKQAFASASADEKSKIKAALQAKGYIYRGGKWTKK